MNLDDPFASKAKELQNRRLLQRTGVLEYDHAQLKKQKTRGRRHTLSKKENQTRQPHPPKKAGGERRTRKRRTTTFR